MSGDQSKREREEPRMPAREDDAPWADERERGSPADARRPGMEVSDRDEPAEVARSGREGRAPTPVKDLAIQFGGLLILSPLILMFALIPFGVFGPPELAERLSRVIFVLFVSSFALIFLLIATTWFLPHPKRKKKKPENGKSTRPE